VRRRSPPVALFLEPKKRTLILGQRYPSLCAGPGFMLWCQKRALMILVVNKASSVYVLSSVSDPLTLKFHNQVHHFATQLMATKNPSCACCKQRTAATE
jgi:hypothetical protein